MSFWGTTGQLPPYWLEGAELMHQQCWCWGQDIRHPEGNLLLRYGLQRARPPRQEGGSSRYVWSDAGSSVALWGFGVCHWVRDCGGVYVNRYCFVPRWLPEEFPIKELWQVDQLAGLRRPGTRRQIRRSRRLVKGLIRWIAAYERWVQGACGEEYRHRVLAGWKQTRIPADQMDLSWERLGRHVEEPPPELIEDSRGQPAKPLLGGAAWNTTPGRCAAVNRVPFD